jgi:hypothetical protein
VGHVKRDERRVKIPVFSSKGAVRRIGDAKGESFVEPGRGNRATELHVVMPCRDSHIRFDAEVGQAAILANRGWCVIEGIWARGIREVISAYKSVGGEQCLRANDARVSGCDVESGDVLVLILLDRV